MYSFNESVTHNQRLLESRSEKTVKNLNLQKKIELGIFIGR